MAKYHSTLGRREFLKARGLGGVGLGASALVPALSPPVRDLDEAMASPIASMKRPSWVKEVAKPTIEIDWDIMKRFNDYEVMWAGGFLKADGPEQPDIIIRVSSANTLLWR